MRVEPHKFKLPSQIKCKVTGLLVEIKQLTFNLNPTLDFTHYFNYPVIRKQYHIHGKDSKGESYGVIEGNGFLSNLYD